MKPSSLLDQLGYVPILPFLTVDEERELGERVATGDLSAVATLVEHHMPYAAKLALRRYGRYGGDLDAIWSGALDGLRRAAYKFDHTLGFKFVTYADFWIREGIQREIDNTADPIHIPVYVREMLSRVAEGEPPVTWTPNERERRHHEHVIEKALAVKRPILRDHDRPGEDRTIRDSPLLAIAARDSEPDVDLILAEMIQRMKDEIDRLPDRDREILLSRYGIDCERESAESIAKQYRISRRTVIKIEKHVLIHLREILNRQFQEKST